MNKTVSVIGVSMDLGASRSGARLGPEMLRMAGLISRIKALGLQVRECADIVVAPEDSVDGGPGRPKHVQAIVNASSAIADAVEAALRTDTFPVVVGGDHSMAAGVMAGIARVLGPQGIIWIDAHADLNTPDSSPTGNLHGMSMAAALGEMQDIFAPGVFPSPAADAKRCVFIGLRELDPAEKRRIHDLGIACFTMSDIDRIGMGRALEKAIAIAGHGPGSVHVSYDIDSLDPSLAPGTGTPVRGGLTYREAHLAMEMIAKSGVAHSLELAEVNPLLDTHNKTARLAAELICSLLGKAII
ncbi:MAG: arginase [Candidatus Eremiobacter antarcticus]